MHVPSSLTVELYRAAQVAELDRVAIQDRGIPGYTLMCRAGADAFAALQQYWPQARRVAVVCGSGNNGGDGYVVARLAQESGLDVRVVYLKDPAQLKGDALTACHDAHSAGVSVESWEATSLKDAEVIVDAIFGIGLSREVEGRYRQAIEAVNARDAGVLAIDIPSGLHADTGAVMGVAVQATVTTTFIALKQGLFTGQGPAYCGAILFGDLEVPADIYGAVSPASQRYSGEDLAELLPKRFRSAHKGYHGHVLVVGGDHGMGGAVRMAAEAAARCGAGLTSIATRGTHAGLQAAARPELMFHGVESADQLSPLLERATVVAVGPGLGRAAWGRELLDAILASDRPLVVDADGLNLLSEKPVQRGNWILTPHPGEAGRLLGMSPKQVEADRFAAVNDLVERFGGVCVLKGAGSLIGAQGSPLWVNSSGNPGMASGGMGDILTGTIAGLLAQGLTLAEAARAGVYIHGRAGDLSAEANRERGMLAMDLMPLLRALVNPV